ncbi:hypothetical protein NPIL_192021 [Nephila pilipes]|uniref:Uncharacterized protein n=1 Tax=Nephila pilipes TaxID=299642 RepID=A0A8X6Q687_NEPPI|nr:hypothetical protein NPIL_192021 [Nephila pilipes]
MVWHLTLTALAVERLQMRIIDQLNPRCGIGQHRSSQLYLTSIYGVRYGVLLMVRLVLYWSNFEQWPLACGLLHFANLKFEINPLFELHKSCSSKITHDVILWILRGPSLRKIYSCYPGRRSSLSTIEKNWSIPLSYWFLSSYASHYSP